MDTYSVLLVLRILLVAILYLVILRVVSVARREMKMVQEEERAVRRLHNIVGYLTVENVGSIKNTAGPRALHRRDRLDIKEITTIGRDPANDIMLESTFVSGYHTRVFFKDGSLWVEDLNSHNGTFVSLLRKDGNYQGLERITKETAVTPKTILQVGDVIFKFDEFKF